MTPNQFLRILWARRAIVLAGMLLIAGIALVASLLLPKQFSATAEVIVDLKAPDPVMGTALPQQALAGFMATQIEIVESERVARAVVDALALADSQAWQKRWMDATGGDRNFASWLPKRLQKDLDVRSSREGNIIRISVRSTDATEAARLANAFANAYLQTAIALRVEPARQNARFFDEQRGSARESLERAQARLSTFQRQNAISSADERLDIEQTRLVELSSQLAMLQGMVADSQSRGAATAKGGAGALPETLESRLVQKLRGDLADADAKLQKARLQLGEAHPEFQRLESEAATLRTKLDAEVDRYAQGVRTTGAINERRLAEVRKALEEQRTKVLKIRALRDELAVLQDDVQAARRNLETIAQRQVTTTLESQSRQTNAALLTPAVTPVEPSSPRLVLNVAGGMLFGLLLGAAVALLMEQRLRPVRAVVDLVDAIPTPVLVVVPGARGMGRTSTLPRASRLVTAIAAEPPLKELGR